MVPIDILPDRPPVPPKSPLRSKRCSVVSIPSIHTSEKSPAVDSDRMCARLDQSINNMLDRVRPSSERLESHEFTPSHQRSSSRSSISGSSTYSIQLNAFPLPPLSVRPRSSPQRCPSPVHPAQPQTARQYAPTSPKSSISSAPTSPTSSRISYSSSRQMSIASTHTAYSVDSIPPTDGKGPSQLSVGCSLDGAEQGAGQPIHAMIEQLSPIIYQDACFPLKILSARPDRYYRHSIQPVQIQLDAYVNSPAVQDFISEAMFPPHPGVRPPAARKNSSATVASHASSKLSIGSRVLAVAKIARTLPMSVAVPTRRSSLKFGKKRLRGQSA